MQSVRSVNKAENAIEESMDAQVALSIAGDKRAFERLYRYWRPRWLQFACWLVGDRDDALDVTQDASVAIAQNIHRLKDPAMFKAWSFTIVRRRAADHVRGAIKTRRLTEALQREPEPPLRDDTATTTMSDLLQLVSADDQQLLTLFYVVGLNVAELAGALDVPAGTVKSRLFNARARLRRAWESEQPGERHE